MAVNIPLAQGPNGAFPLPFPNELFLLTRDKTTLSFSDASQHKHKKLKGRLIITNMRLVFLLASPTSSLPEIHNLEIPFRGLWDERLNQPIFGPVNLSMTVQYYDEQPFVGELSARINFIEGGVNTFLPVFNNVLRATRVQLAHEQAAQHTETPPPIPTHEPAPQQDYLPGSAYVDPSDPSRLYTTQPATQETRQDAPSWHPSAGGLRRR